MQTKAISELNKKEKAQTTVEFILIVGAFVLISVILMPKILSNLELNKAISAARDGAEFAIAMIGMGYSTPSGTLGSSSGIIGTIKIKNITLIEKGACSGNVNKKWYQIKFYVYIPSHMSDAKQNITTTIRNYAGGNLYRAFYGSYKSTLNKIETERYCFTTSVSLISY